MLRILHLEDEPADTEIVQDLLCEELDCQLDHTADLAEFRAALERGGYDLVLADYTIPGTDPLEALRITRHLRPEVPFIFLSGTIGEDTAIETLKLGACDYVLKQRMERLIPAIRRALQESETLKGKTEAEQKLHKANEQLQQANEDLERTVQERTARLRETNQELESFCANLSHDMRGSLRAIQSFSELLFRFQGEKLDPSGRNYLEQITRAAGRLEALFGEVLKLSKVTQEAVKLERVNVTDLVENLIREDPNLQPPQALVQIDRLDTALGHKALLTQCFSNLLNNAAKFVPPGQVPHIRIHSEIVLSNRDNLVPFPRQESPPGAKMVRFWVDDNGIGVPKEDQERVFELFHRVHEGYEGTGLGLSIVRKATERMGGLVGVESEPSQGSKFWLQLHAA